jgi:hypothetical protein
MDMMNKISHFKKKYIKCSKALVVEKKNWRVRDINSCCR